MVGYGSGTKNIPMKSDRHRRGAEAIRRHRWILRAHRQNKTKFIEQYVGRNFGQSDSTIKREPANLFRLAAGIYQQHLFPGTPRVSITTDVRGMEAIASNRTLVVNMLLEEIDFGTTLKLCGLDGILLAGIAWTGLMPFTDVEIGGELMDPGQPGTRRVDLNDWCHDTAAGEYQDVQFATHRTELPLDWAKKWKGFKASARKDLKAIEGYTLKGGENDPKDVSQKGEHDAIRYFDVTKVWSCWYPKDRTVVTYPTNESGNPHHEILAEEDFDGIEGGPYDVLGLGDAPGHVMPLSPMSNLYEPHIMANESLRKCARQAEASKRGMAFRSNQKRDAKQFVEFNDGEAFFVDDPTTGKIVQTGGIDQLNLAFFLQMVDKFVYLAGNLDSLAGLSPQADTLGQEQLLAANSSKMISDMEQRARRFELSIVKKLANYLFKDPLYERNTVKRIGTSQRYVPVTITTEDLEADYEHNFKFMMSSAAHQSPQQKLAVMTAAWDRWIVPMMQAGILQAQKLAPRADYIMRTIADLTGVSEVAEMVGVSMNREQIGELPSHQRQYMASTQPTPPRTTRQTSSRAGRDGTMQQLMMGAGVQRSQQDQIGSTG